MGKPWTAEEKRLVVESPNKKKFMDDYIAKLGVPDKLGRLDSLWGQRKELRETLGKVDVGKISQRSTGIIPHPRGENLPDVGEVLVNISNTLKVMSSAVLQMEQMHKEQLELFKQLSVKRVKDGTNEDPGIGTGS